ncbi:MAG: hypothetical protein PHN75_09630 [Syntrophales bacterium]|nr:hypothetical protein [Syntrophales bacterium]
MKGYGAIVLDEKSEREFDQFYMDPGRNYYFCGAEDYPTAIIGLNKEYVLANDAWRVLPVTPAEFGEKIRSMQHIAKKYSHSQRGFAMKDPLGKTIGVWYSIISLENMTVRMGEGNRVDVFTPGSFDYND